MVNPPSNSIHPKTRAEWREWLSEHHNRAEGVWVISFKKASGKPRLEYDEAVEEALCFGWVDSKANKLGLRKSAAFFARDLGGRMLKGGRMSVATQFQPGATPWNKGQHYQALGRSIDTQFKPGARPHTWRPVGSLRVNADGYLQRKLTDTRYPPRDWVAVHRTVWEAAHGPVPGQHVVVFKRTGQPINMEEGRDMWWHDLMALPIAEELAAIVPIPQAVLDDRTTYGGSGSFTACIARVALGALTPASSSVGSKTSWTSPRRTKQPGACAPSRRRSTASRR